MFTRTEPKYCCYSYMLHNAVTSCALMSCFGADEDSQDERSTSTCNLSKKKKKKCCHNSPLATEFTAIVSARDPGFGGSSSYMCQDATSVSCL